MIRRRELGSGSAVRALIVPLGLVGLLASCMGLPEADGTEAAINSKVAGMPVLTAGSGSDAPSVARNSLMLSPSVREAASAVAADADTVRVNRAALFPSLGISLGGGRGDASTGDATVTLQGQQLLADFGNTRRAVTIADFELQISYLEFQKAVDDALVKALEAYDAVAMHQALLGVRRKQLAAMREIVELVGERVESGAASSPDVLESRKRLLAAEFEVHDAELALAEARDRLLRLTGQSAGGQVPAPRGTCAAPADTDDKRIAALRLGQSQLNLERAERARLPRLVVSPLAKRQVGDGGVDLGVNVGVESDLLQGGALTARANAARNSRASAEAGVEAAELDADLLARELGRDITAGTRKIEMLGRQIDLLAETRELYRSQYFDLGTRQLTDLLDNEDEYYNSQAERITLRSSVLSSRLRCAAISRTLRDGLELKGNSLYGYPLDPDAL